MDEAVRGFKVFGDNAAIYAAYIMATLEWGKMYCHYGGRDTVPVLPEWLTTYIGVTRSLTTNVDLPQKCVLVGHSDVRLNSVATCSGWHICCSSGPTSPVRGSLVAFSATPVPWPSS